jgi:hypothetical protein
METSLWQLNLGLVWLIIQYLLSISLQVEMGKRLMLTFSWSMYMDIDAMMQETT